MKEAEANTCVHCSSKPFTSAPPARSPSPPPSSIHLLNPLSINFITSVSVEVLAVFLILSYYAMLSLSCDMSGIVGGGSEGEFEVKTCSEVNSVAAWRGAGCQGVGSPVGSGLPVNVTESSACPLLRQLIAECGTYSTHWGAFCDSEVECGLGEEIAGNVYAEGSWSHWADRYMPHFVCLWVLCCLCAALLYFRLDEQSHRDLAPGPPGARHRGPRWLVERLRGAASRHYKATRFSLLVSVLVCMLTHYIVVSRFDSSWTSRPLPHPYLCHTPIDSPFTVYQPFGAVFSVLALMTLVQEPLPRALGEE